MFARRFAIAIVLLMGLLTAPVSFAYPMANLSVNHYTTTILEPAGGKTVLLEATAFRTIVPEPLHPWLDVLSGLIIAAMGGYMLLRRLAGAATGHHDHTAPGTHPHWITDRIPDGLLNGRWFPIVFAAFIMILGGGLSCHGLAAANLHLSSLSPANLGPLIYVIGLGLLLGMRHSTDADHVVAISTIVSRQRNIRSATFIGSVWGIGHTITIFIVGGLIILFGVKIPPRLGLSMEFCVAVMLVVLGILNLTGVLRRITQRYTPNQSAPRIDVSMAQQATFLDRTLHRRIERFGTFQFLRPLVIGLVHGLAGSAAVALLVLSTIHNPVWATFYLLIFGAGTMIGMMCMTTAIAVPFTYAGDRFSRLSQYLTYASGLASLCFGSFLVYRLGYIGNLFGSHPTWTPQ